MKIAICIQRLTQGGSERQVFETAKLLAQEGHQVYVAVFDLKSNYYHFIDPRIKVVDLKLSQRMGNAIIRFLKLYLFIRKVRPDFALSYLEVTNKYLGRVAAVLKSKQSTYFVGSERNIKLQYLKSQRKLCKQRQAYEALDGVITNSRIIQDIVSTELGIDQKKIFVLKNLLNTNFFKPIAVARVEWSDIAPQVSPSKLLILVPARIVAQKNQKILVETAALLISKGFKEFQFLLAGNENYSYAAELRDLIKSRRLGEHFVFLGMVPETQINRVYNLSDIIVLPSLWEGFSNSIIEALACGRIVVTTGVSDISDLVSNGENGFVVEVSSAAQQIAEVILAIINMSQERKATLQRKARETVLSLSPETFLKNFYAILDKIKAARISSANK